MCDKAWLIEWTGKHVVKSEHFDLEDLMIGLGSKGHHVFVRYDPERETHMFTVMVDNLPRVDTDNPLLTLCELANEVLDEG
jgi:hypothetical protein